MKERSMGKVVFCTTALMLVSIMSASAQEAEEIERQFQHRMHQLEIEERELDLASRRAEVNFQRELKKIQLEKKRAEVSRKVFPHWKKKRQEFFHLFFMICLVINLLLTVWVYQDIHRRKVGSGLWIGLVLLGGIPAAIVYAISRIANGKTA